MYTNKNILENELKKIKEEGLYKSERQINSDQKPYINVQNKEVLNFCANNYLGLSNNKTIIKSAQLALKKWGFGLSSVRFICGTQTIHKQLEKNISKFLNKEDTILYTSCFDANGGLFETLLNQDDAILTTHRGHGHSIAKGTRLKEMMAEIIRLTHF